MRPARNNSANGKISANGTVSMAAIGIAEPRPRLQEFEDALSRLAPPLLLGVRLWLSVCVALFVAFWLDLDKPLWAGTSAAVVCQPHLGAALNKGWARVIGTVAGATIIVLITACFPENRFAYLGLLALWASVCAFAATVLRNFASYGASLAGFTAVIIAADNLGATGGASPDVFMLAVKRASEICIGILCAGLVHTVTDLGGDRRWLAGSITGLASEIMGGFARMLAQAGPQMPDTRPERRAFLRRVIGLMSDIDQTLGESSRVHRAAEGLFTTLSGWRGIATHLHRSPEDVDRQAAADTVFRSFPSELRSAGEPGANANWKADRLALRRICMNALRTLYELPAGTPSLRLLADETARALTGMLRVLDGVALLVDAEALPPSGRRGFRLVVADWLPAYVNAIRAFIVFVAVALFWIVTAWPDGAWAMVFATIVVLLLAPRGDLAFGASVMFALGVVCTVPIAATVKFALLPGLQMFPAFCLAIGLVLFPAGFAMAYFQQPAVRGFFTATGFNFVPLLGPTNQMSYDTLQFYNSALAIVVGCSVAPLAFRLLPPLSPALRARRLLALSLRDLRRLAIGRLSLKFDEWDRRILTRLGAFPDQAEPVQRAQLLTMLSIGGEIIRLREIGANLGVVTELDAAFAAFAQGHSADAIARLNQIDRNLASGSDTALHPVMTLRARSHLLVIGEALGEYASYFDDGEGA